MSSTEINTSTNVTPTIMAGQQMVATFITQTKEFLENRHAFYTPLDPNRSQIRLMHIQPGQDQEPIHLELSTIDLADDPVYDAISYTWGDVAQIRTVYVHDIAYHVTQNQHETLQRLRSLKATRGIFMDVISIDQANHKERTHQVSIMGDVYAKASGVDVWIGGWDNHRNGKLPDEQWVDLVYMLKAGQQLEGYQKPSSSLLRDMLMIDLLQIEEPIKRAEFILHQLAGDVHFREFPYCIIIGEDILLWRPWYDAVFSLFEIFRRRWWTRVWTLQEVLLFKGNARILLGEHSLNFDIFWKASMNFGRHVSQAGCCLKFLKPVFYWNEDIDRMCELGTMTNLKRDERPGAMRIHVAIRLVSGRQASDARDYLYGVLGLTRLEDRVNVDYTLTTEQVFALATWSVFKSENNFNHLETAAFPSGNRSPKMPSWCVDWAGTDYGQSKFPFSHTFEMSEEPDWERTQFDGNISLVANKLTTIKLTFTKVHEDLKLTDCRNHHTLLWSWLRAIEHAGLELGVDRWVADNDSMDASFVQFFGTILRNTCVGIFRAAVTRLSKTDWQVVRQWWHLLNKCYDEDDHRAYPGDDVDLTMIITTFHWSTEYSTLAVTMENKLCLVPETTKAGDSLYHIRAFGSPVVLRESGADIFKLVGIAFQAGMMGSKGWKKDEEKVITLI